MTDYAGAGPDGSPPPAPPPSPAQAGDRIDFGRIIKHTFGAIQHNAANFAILALLLAGLPALLSTTGLIGLLGQASKIQVQGGGLGALTGMALPGALTGLGGLVGLITNAILQGAIIFGAASYFNGRPATFSDCLNAGARRCLPLIGLFIVMGFAVLFGILFFIVPGIMMAIAWVAATPVLVVERTGVFAALGRSADLTRGRRWPIFGLVILSSFAIGIIQNIIIGVVGGLFSVGASRMGQLTAQLPVSAMIGVAASVLTSTGIAALYYELRSTREGIGPEALAAVFD